LKALRKRSAIKADDEKPSRLGDSHSSTWLVLKRPVTGREAIVIAVSVGHNFKKLLECQGQRAQGQGV
jgi:hypothetical protein